jgi:transcriptional regulator GlxA family with amidase domain
MTRTEHRISIALLATRDATASTLYGVYDLLASAGRDWDMIVNGTPGTPLFDLKVVAASTDVFHGGNGVRIQPDAAFGDDVPDVIFVPELLVAPDDDFGKNYRAEIAWVKRCHDAGAIIATACSGALLLAESGLLDGEDATIHWGYVNFLAARYPKVRVHGSRALVISGEDHRLIMAGGGTTWTDLALLLVARLANVEEAVRLSKLFLIDWHNIGQLPFASLTCARQIDDALVAKCQVWIAQNYNVAAPVAAMINLSGINERTFKRRFVSATGMSPLEYVHNLRLEEAKQMLEISDDSIDTVANQVGYEDASFFSRLFKRKVGTTPQAYRKRFRLLRENATCTGRLAP